MDLRSAGVMEGWAVSQGQWWRLFTAIWLHADIGHLASNASIGVVLLGLAMGRYGTGVGLLAAYLAGVGGNLAVWWLSAGPPGSLGASGMVMGCLGLLAAQSLSWRNPGAQRLKVLISGVLGGVMLFVLFGLAPETDVRAHLGGFISGLVLGAVLTLSPGLPHRVMVNVTSGLLFALLVIWPWWAALHHQLHP
jgi:rhomboid protease GluP